MTSVSPAMNAPLSALMEGMGLWRAGDLPGAAPPPPPPPPPPASYAPPPPALGPPPPPGGGKKSPALGIVLGCGCLLVLALLIAGGLYAWFAIQKPEIVGPQKTEETVSTTDAGDKATPSESAAVKAALQGRTGWTAEAIDHADDWTTATLRVWRDQEGLGYTEVIKLKWNGDSANYEVESSRQDPIAEGGEETTKPDPTAKTKPQSGAGTGGSEAQARAVGLAQAPEKNWVVKVSRHSADWKTATVIIGPPASEFVAEYDLKWDGKHYQVIKQRDTGF